MSETTLRAPLPDADAARAALKRPAAVRLAWLAAALVVVAAACLASFAFGVRDVTFEEILRGLSGDTSGVSEAAVAARIPRTALGLLVGAALGLAGTTFQAVTRNPLADPGIFGITSGASLAVVGSLAFFGLSGAYPTMGVAIAGAAVTAVFVYSVGSLGSGGATPLKLALAGAATTAALQSLISAVLLPRVDLLEQFRFWQIGGVGGATWDRISLLTPVLVVGALVVFAMARGMNSLALGDDLAASLGEHVGRTRVVATIGAVILCGAATAIAGPIAFIGLIVPHVCRLTIGTDHRWLLPASAIAGAGLLVIADVIGRLVLPSADVEVGIVAALIGAPFFIWIVRRQRVREL